MIERQVIDGRPASVAYLKADLKPAKKGEEAFVRIIYDDGETVLLTPPPKLK